MRIWCLGQRHTREEGGGIWGGRGSCWTMSTASQASRSGPINSKRVCSTLKSRSLFPFLSFSLSSALSPPGLPPPLSFPCFPSPFAANPRASHCLSPSLVRSFSRLSVSDVNDATGGHGPTNPKSPFPRYKAWPLFSAWPLRRLRADAFLRASQATRVPGRATKSICIRRIQWYVRKSNPRISRSLDIITKHRFGVEQVLWCCSRKLASRWLTFHAINSIVYRKRNYSVRRPRVHSIKRKKRPFQTSPHDRARNCAQLYRGWNCVSIYSVSYVSTRAFAKFENAGSKGRVKLMWKFN